MGSPNTITHPGDEPEPNPNPTLTPTPTPHVDSPRSHRPFKWSRTLAPHPTIRARLLASLHQNLKNSRERAHNARRGETLRAMNPEMTQADIDALYHELDVRQREEEDALLRQFEMLELAETPVRSETKDGLPCPVCADGSIGIVAGVVVCRCGLRVGGDGVTEEFVRERLCQVFEKHWRCDGLRFEERRLDELETGFLWSVCGCGEEDIVV